jgi:hypothetical protein
MLKHWARRIDAVGISVFVMVLVSCSQNASQRTALVSIAPADAGGTTKPANDSTIKISGDVVEDNSGEPLWKFQIQWGWQEPSNPDAIHWGPLLSFDKSWQSRFNAELKCPAGAKVTVRAKADGYVPERFRDNFLTAPSQIADHEFRLIHVRSDVAVRGVVLDYRGKPVAGAKVFIANYGGVTLREDRTFSLGDNSKPDDITDKDGRFYAQGTGPEEVVISTPNLYDYHAVITDPTKEATIHLPEPASLEIHCDVDDSPRVSEFELTAQGDEDPVGLAKISRSPKVVKGSFLTISDLAPGKYKLTRLQFLTVSFPNTPDRGWRTLIPLENKSITLESGKTTNVTFPRPIGSPVRGKVVGLEHSPMRGAMIVAIPGDVEFGPIPLPLSLPLPNEDSVMSEPDGTFTTPRLLPGEYTIIAVTYDDAIQPFSTGIFPIALFGTAKVIVPAKGIPPLVQIIAKPFESKMAIPATQPSTESMRADTAGPNF